MLEGLDDGYVGVGLFDVFADDRDGQFVKVFGIDFNDAAPVVKIGWSFLYAEGLADELADAHILHNERDGIDIIYGGEVDDPFDGDVTVHRDLSFGGFGHILAVAAAEDQVGLDTESAQDLDAVLGGLGLYFAVRDGGEQGQVDVAGAFDGGVAAELADGLQEGLAFDVTDGSADFDDEDIGFGFVDELQDVVFDGVGNVGDGLDCYAEVLTAAFGAD